MLTLPNCCKCSDPTLSPLNWDKSSTSVKKIWYIQFYFYPPGSDKGVLRIYKGGLNKIKTYPEKKAAAKLFLEEMIKILKEGFNPLTREFIQDPTEDEESQDISPSTPFNEALQYSFDNLSVEPSTKLDIRSTLKYFSLSAAMLKLDKTAVSEIDEGHVKRILNNCVNILVPRKDGSLEKKTWNNNQYNHYRKYISILFSELKEYKAIKYNPAKELSKQKTLKRIRTTLTDGERKNIDQYLRLKNFDYWRLMHIFFHSGARETELCNITFQDVELHNQRFKVVIKKGREHIEKWKVIKTIALPLWNSLMNECKPGQYVFALGFKPGDIKLRTELISRYWRRLVKIPLGITADFYSLKHLNSTEIVSLLDEQSAAAMNSHTTTAMVRNIYDTLQEERQATKLKSVNNSFS